MGGGNRRNARWIIAVLAGALVASAVVVYALVRMTSPSDDGSGIASTAVTNTHESPSDSAGDTTSSSTIGISGTNRDDEASPSTTSVDTVTSSSGEFNATQSVPPTTTAELPDSHVVLPAAWSGVAKVTITVLGDCAASNSSVYADLPADLALDLVQNEANAAQTPLPAGADPDNVTMTLGVNPSGVPSLAVYSSQIDENGSLQRFWNVDLAGDTHRTSIHGTLIAQPSDGSTPNMMVDAETSLQPCESLGTVSLPRALANGSTVEGWVTPTNASLTLHGTTTDGKRTVSVTITAHRAE